MTAAPESPIAVFITAPNIDEASRIAELLVERKLAACVQILPSMESVYRWQGKVARQAEILLIAKTASSKFAELEREVRAVHSYETPEIVAVPLTALSEPYRQWLNESLTVD
jgi:periplasmic divalent cation tolerance protein